MNTPLGFWEDNGEKAMSEERPFEPNETLFFVDGETRINLYIENTKDRHMWALSVNGVMGTPTSWHEGVCKNGDYYYATEYWEGFLPVGKPFRAVVCNWVSNLPREKSLMDIVDMNLREAMKSKK